MLVICVALLKGGVSKTTTALAEVATLSVPTVAIHTDPMGSLRRWAELAAEAGHPLRSQVNRAPRGRPWARAADRRADRGGVSPVSGSTGVARPPVIKDSGPLACTDVKPEMGRP
jgi:hypothetical protein